MAEKKDAGLCIPFFRAEKKDAAQGHFVSDGTRLLVCRHTRALPLPLVLQLAALSHVSLLPEHLGLQEIKERAPIHMRRLQKKDGGVWFRSCI